MYPESLVWKAAAYVGVLTAITFFSIGYRCARCRRRDWRLDTTGANKPLGYPVE
jgi:hypothetical protein